MWSMQGEVVENSAGLVYRAADGCVGVLRLVGGRVRPGMWGVVADLAEWGDGQVHVTSRGNLRVRGLSDPEGFAGAAQAAGFRAGCSVIASPFARLDAVVAELEQLVGGVAPHSMLLGIDDGSGDVLARRPDLGVQVDAGRGVARVIHRGVVAGPELSVAQALEVVARRCVDGVGAGPEVVAASTGEAEVAPVGWFGAGDDSVALAAGLQFGVLEGRVARMLDVIGVETTVTPWRGLVIHDLSESVADQVVRVLAPLGLIFNAESPWLRVSACVAAPGCRHALSEVRGDAAQAVAGGVSGRVHFVGCARNCGRPKGAHTLYQATGDGEYEVFGG